MQHPHEDNDPDRHRDPQFRGADHVDEGSASAFASTGRSVVPRTAVHGITYPSTSQGRAATTSSTAAGACHPSIISRTPSTLPAAVNVKNPKARPESARSARISREKASSRHDDNPSSPTNPAAVTLRISIEAAWNPRR
ncbi:hypothetical protein [Rhodococcus sp. CH91]|uniref:hypothetical protein n=1 Tax=Rhodococcus sp. CH91 TaxID=2910256 RepID=UPI001F4BC982|nr:hypothetical protein [Rhodococcus sp. CH91]